MKQCMLKWAITWIEGLPYPRFCLTVPAAEVQIFKRLRTFSIAAYNSTLLFEEQKKIAISAKLWLQAIVNNTEMPIDAILPQFGILAIDAALSYFQSQRGLEVSNEAVLEQLHDQGFCFATMAHVEEARQDFEDEEEAEAHWEESKSELFKDLL